MGVLFDCSKSIVFIVYWFFMMDKDLFIIDFYFWDFEFDMNGKKMDWEVVVKIFFIDEKCFFDVMVFKNDFFFDEEKVCNDFGVVFKFMYFLDVDFEYVLFLVDVFLYIFYCYCVENIFDFFLVEGFEYCVGFIDGVLLNVEVLVGFLFFVILFYMVSFGFYGVNVFK